MKVIGHDDEGIQRHIATKFGGSLPFRGNDGAHI